MKTAISIERVQDIGTEKFYTILMLNYNHTSLALNLSVNGINHLYATKTQHLTFWEKRIEY